MTSIMMDVDLPPVDLDTIVSSYAPAAAVRRLLFISERAESESFVLDALRHAADLLKKGDNTGAYASVVERIGGRLGPEYELDRAWVEETDRRAAKRQEILDAELNGYKTNMIKESIRMGHADLGDFYRDRGDPQTAFKCYVRTRDYCTTPRHVVQMCLNVVRVGVESENYAHVGAYASKALSLPDAVVAADPAAIAQLGRAAGLAALHSRRYAQAARKFTDVTACGDHGESADELMTAADAATYGGLCALATFERDELRRRAVDAPAFRAALESAPEIRGIIDDFYGSRYASALDALRRARPRLELDPHLRDVTDDLRRAIRERALAQYVSPYVTVDLAKMAVAFGGDGTTESVAALEKELAGLIVEEKIAARIDSREKTLWKKSSDARATAYERATAAGREHRAECRAALVRAALVENDLIVRAGPGGGERARMIPSRRGARARGRGGRTDERRGRRGRRRAPRGRDAGGGGRANGGGQGRWEWKGWTRRTRWISWSRAGRGKAERRETSIRRDSSRRGCPSRVAP